MKMKKLFVAEIFFVLFFLVGCRKQEDIGYLASGYRAEGTVISEDTLLFSTDEETVYYLLQSETASLQGYKVRVKQYQGAGGNGGNEISETELTVGFIQESNGGAEESETAVLQMEASQDGKLWFLLRSGPNGKMAEGSYCLYSYDVWQDTVKKISVERAVPSNVILTGMCSDRKGNLCIYDADGKLYLFSQSGDFLSQEQIQGGVTATGISENGNSLVVGYERGKSTVYEVDAEKQKIIKRATVQEIEKVIYGIKEIADQVFALWTDDQLIVWDAGTKQVRDTWKWEKNGISGKEVARIAFEENGSLRVFQIQVADGKGTFKETMLLPVTDENALDETIMTIATYGGLSYKGKQKVTAFNALECGYKVEVVDYMISGGSYEDALVRLQADIAAGEGPDMIGLETFDFENLCEGNILEDLNPYMERDDEFHEEDYFGNILKYYERGGKTLGLITEFRVIAGMADEQLLRRYDEWSVEAIYHCLDENPQIQVMFGDYRSNVLNLFLCSKADFWDQETGKCAFDTPEFMKLLEYSYRYGYPVGETTTATVEDGTRLVRKLLAYDPLIGQAHAQLGMVPGGLPIGNSSRMLIGKDGIAMSMAACSDEKQAVWEFMKFCLSEEMQISDDFPGMNAFPVKRDNFLRILDVWSEPKMLENENGIMEEAAIYTFKSKDVIYDVYAISDAERENFIEVVEKLDQMEHLDSILFNIIMEEADFYFDGEKTVEEVVDIIQNRAQLYMDEMGVHAR